MSTSFLRIVMNRTITYVSIILADYLSSEIFGMIFLSDYRIVEEKKRYDKLNDAAYSALKCRDCAANVFFNLPACTYFRPFLFASDRSYPFLPALAHFHPSVACRTPVLSPDTERRGTDSVSPVPRSPPVSPIFGFSACLARFRPFRFSCLRLFLCPTSPVWLSGIL